MRPMTGRLARSRSPPQPKTTCTRPPPACASGRTVRSTPSKGGFVRVVDRDRQAAVVLDALETAGHCGDGRERGGISSGVRPEGDAGGRGGEEILGVRVAEERGIDGKSGSRFAGAFTLRWGTRNGGFFFEGEWGEGLHLDLRAIQPERRAPEDRREEAPGRCRDGAAQGSGARVLHALFPLQEKTNGPIRVESARELLSERISEIDDRLPLRLEQTEEARFRLEVLVQVLVEVEMLVREVQEEGDVEGATREPVEDERVRRALERRGRPAVLDEVPEHELELRGLGRRVRRRHGRRVAARPAVDDRSEESAPFVPRREQAVDEECRRRLPARPRDADGDEALARAPREERRHEARGAARILDGEVGHAENFRSGRKSQRGHGAARDGVRDEAAAVRLEPRKRGEERARRRGPRVVRDRRDLRVSRRAAPDVRRFGGERRELHGSPPSAPRPPAGARTSAHVVPRERGAPGGGSCVATNPGPVRRAATPRPARRRTASRRSARQVRQRILVGLAILAVRRGDDARGGERRASGRGGARRKVRRQDGRARSVRPARRHLEDARPPRRSARRPGGDVAAVRLAVRLVHDDRDHDARASAGRKPMNDAT